MSRKAGIVGQRDLAELPDYRTSDALSDLDRRVIEFAERLTMTPADVPEPLYSEIRRAIGDDAMVELASVIAWENYRSRFNRAFDVQAQGYCEGGLCVLPARPLSPDFVSKEVPPVVLPHSTTRVPGFVRLFGPLMLRLLSLGVLIGPAALLTVRGRRSGLPRTTSVGLIESGGRYQVFGAYGEVNWVRNLRAAGEGVIRIRGRPQRISAVELSREDAAAFYREVLVPYVSRLEPLHRLFLRRLLGRLLADVLIDPARAASRHPVFELHAQAGGLR